MKKRNDEKEKNHHLRQKPRVMIVENDSLIAKDIKYTLESLGYEVTSIAFSGKEAIKKVKADNPDLVLMDIVLNGNLDGIHAASKIRKYANIPIVYLTAYADNKILQRAKITKPYGYIIKPFKDGELRTTVEIALYKHRTEQKLRESSDKLRKALESTVNALAYAAEMRDPYTAGHQKRVAFLTVVIAKEMDTPEDEIEGIRMAALIHDIGKIHVPAEILNKPHKLTDAEFEIVKTHSQIGYDILERIDFPWPVADYVLQHHERLDGSGYPQELVESQIKQGAKILAVADVVEAMLSHRPYRPAHDVTTTLEVITSKKETLYDPQIADICLRLFKENGFRFR
jgi:putative nucleotidyltransferase with HDIG domain